MATKKPVVDTASEVAANEVNSEVGEQSPLTSPVEFEIFKFGQQALLWLSEQGYTSFEALLPYDTTKIVPLSNHATREQLEAFDQSIRSYQSKKQEAEMVLSVEAVVEEKSAPVKNFHRNSPHKDQTPPKFLVEVAQRAGIQTSDILDYKIYPEKRQLVIVGESFGKRTIGFDEYPDIQISVRTVRE